MMFPAISIAGFGQRSKGDLEAMDARSGQILVTLLALRAFSPQSGLPLRSIAKSLGVHHQQVKRRIMGDKGCRSRLRGLVRWSNGRGRKGTRVWLSEAGKTVAIGLLAGVPFSTEAPKGIAHDPQKWLEILALLGEGQTPKGKAQAKNGTPTLKNNSDLTVSYDEDKVPKAAKKALKTFHRATTALFKTPLSRRDFGFRCLVGRKLIAAYGLDAAIGIVRHAQRAWTEATPSQCLRFALKHHEALYEAHLRECQRRENLRRLKAMMRPFLETGKGEKAPTPVPALKGDRAERAAEIAASDQPLRPLAALRRPEKKRCPRCGTERFDLPIKRFERLYRQVSDAEADRWDGKEVCDKCFKALRVAETKAFLKLSGVDLDEATPPLGHQKPEEAMTPPPKPPSAESPPTPPRPLRTEKLTPIGDVLKGLSLPTFSPPTEPTDRPAGAPNALSGNLPKEPTHQPANAPSSPNPSASDSPPTEAEGGKSPFRAILESLEAAYPSPPSPDEPVPCPRCGRLVKRKWLGTSGVCLRCVEEELRRRRLEREQRGF